MRKTMLYSIIWGLALILATCGGKQVENIQVELTQVEVSSDIESSQQDINSSEAVPPKKPNEDLVYPPLNQPHPPTPQRVELDNGMIVYLLEDHDFPIIDIDLRLHTGAIYEPADKVAPPDSACPEVQPRAIRAP